MSNWEIGDLALCVDAANWSCPRTRGCLIIQAGQVYTVAGVMPVRDGTAIILGGEVPHYCSCHEGVGGWNPARFRKIRPDEHEACEPEFVTLIKRSKQKVSA